MDTEKLMFGAAYYPEYLPEVRIPIDLGMMRDAGMNTVRIAESTWSTLEPKEGCYDFSYIDEVLQTAEEYGLSVIIGTPTYALPSWLTKKDGDVLVTTKSGRARYGRRQLINLANPTFRLYAERIIRALLSHTAAHPAVIGFQIDNETKHYDNCGKEIEALFREHLKKRFGSTEALNQAFCLAYWSNAIADWDDLPELAGCINAGLAAEFDLFRRSYAASYLSWQADLVREYKRADQFITHNFDFEWKKFGADIAQDGYSYGVQPDINHYEAAQALTIAGTDIYHPTQDALTGAEAAFCGDSIRSLKQSPYLVLETQAQAFKYWTPYPGQLRLHAYSHLASGAAGLLYWNWHSIHNGYETYWRGLLSHDMKPNPAYEEASRIGREWMRLGKKLSGLQKKARTALVTDTHSLTALRWFPIDRDLSYNDVVRWMYDALYELNIECDVVDVHALNPGDYSLIITPVLYSASDELIGSLEAFVKEGGVLVSSFRSFVADEFLSVRSDTLPYRLHRCFGVCYNQFTDPGTATVRGRPAQYFSELLSLTGAESLADYEHPYWSAYAAITRGTYGRGSAYYIGTYTDSEILKSVYRRALADAGLGAEEEPFWPIALRRARSREGKELCFILHFGEGRRTVSAPFEGLELLSGASVKRSEVLSLESWDVKILEAL